MSSRHRGDGDAFLGFIDYARSMLWPDDVLHDPDSDEEPQRPPWSWIVPRVLRTCAAYPSGVTPAILLSDLSQAWGEQRRYSMSKRRLDCPVPSGSRSRRKRLPNTVTIDSIYEKNFLPASSVLEVFIVDVFVLPGTNIWMLSLGDMWSSYTIDLYLHRRYYDLVDSDHAILRKGRGIYLVGCSLRTAVEGHGHLRLLPTEYLVILLDEDQDEDAMLLGAQFCSDSFSYVSLDAFRNGTAYSLYARIESVGTLEVEGNSGHLQRKQITLADNDGVNAKFLLWGEQVLLANLFTVGSMLAADRPFISSPLDSNIDECEKFCLEYGSATQLYIVPFIHQEEPLILTSTQVRHQGSRSSHQTQDVKISQVTLPLNHEGFIDLKGYPFQAYISDLQDKMTGICLIGGVTNIYREVDDTRMIYLLSVKDTTGEIMAKLHFVSFWSLGRIGLGHTIYISGLNCHMSKKKRLELTWFEKDPGVSLINISSLPAILNSSCLHKLSHLSQISSNTSTTHICDVHLDQIEQQQVKSRLLHAICGHFVDVRYDGLPECHFCSISDDKVLCSFHLKVILADESGNICAWCSGNTAVEMLQICPDEFYALPEDEQAMYLCTLENEAFRVALVYTKSPAEVTANVGVPKTEPSWEIVCAERI